MTKLTFSKILVFQNSLTRAEYFAQQQSFISDESTSDVHYDFSSSISVPSFSPKVLAVRSRTFGVGLTHFWILTLLGAGVPYRKWLAGWSDELYVQIVKEVDCGGEGEDGKEWNVPSVGEVRKRTSDRSRRSESEPPQRAGGRGECTAFC